MTIHGVCSWIVQPKQNGEQWTPGVCSSPKCAASLAHEIRKRLGWSQPEAARVLGVTVRTLSRWENNRSQPSLLAMQKIKEAVTASFPDPCKSTISLPLVPPRRKKVCS